MLQNLRVFWRGHEAMTPFSSQKFTYANISAPALIPLSDYQKKEVYGLNSGASISNKSLSSIPVSDVHILKKMAWCLRRLKSAAHLSRIEEDVSF